MLIVNCRKEVLKAHTNVHTLPLFYEHRTKLTGNLIEWLPHCSITKVEKYGDKVYHLSINYDLQVHPFTHSGAKYGQYHETHLNDLIFILKSKLKLLNKISDVLLTITIRLLHHLLQQLNTKVDYKCQHSINVHLDRLQQLSDTCLDIITLPSITHVAR